METFPPGGGSELAPRPAVEFLPGGRSPASGDAFNSWNDYLGLATLITKAVGAEKGPRGDGPAEEEDEEEEDEEEAAAAPYFSGALRWRDWALCAAPGCSPPAWLPAPRRLLKPELPVCVFCRNNKEAVALYTTHILKGPDGRVLCPVLRRYTCPLCGASGDNAHTIKYCPLSKSPPARHARTLLGKKLR